MRVMPQMVPYKFHCDWTSGSHCARANVKYYSIEISKYISTEKILFF